MKMMEQNKKELLMEQVDKIDEVNFLSVVSSNLKDWVKKGGLDA